MRIYQASHMHYSLLTILYALSLIAATTSVERATLSGSVVDIEGDPVQGALISLSDSDAGMTYTVFSDHEGNFNLQTEMPFPVTIAVTAPGFDRERVDFINESPLSVTLTELDQRPERSSAAAWLTLLPDGPEKRRFILDCTGCHTPDWQIMGENGAMRDESSWSQRVDQMILFSGARSSFPIMSSARHPERTAQWLTSHLGTSSDVIPTLPLNVRRTNAPDTEADEFEITEYSIPSQSDLPHDLIVRDDGQVVITGMMTDRLYTLAPESGVFVTEPIPQARANPRAIQIAENGDVWVLLGSAQKIARKEAASGEWAFWSIGMYGHSITLGDDGRVWFNGHFTKEPELIGVLNPESGNVKTYEVPATYSESGDSTIPYGLRMGKDGMLWGTQLAGNKLVRFDTSRRRFKLYSLPQTHSGPRRLDISTDGSVWIPEYANNTLARFDPASEEFEEYPLPFPDSLPYIVREHPSDGTIWIATGAADAVYRFHPETATFDTIPLPSLASLVRHMDIDKRTGDVWVAYGNSPARSPKVARIRVAQNK